MSDRVILHIDIDSFYFSVETAYNGLHLNDKPVVICNNKDNGIILTSNYFARKYNIKSGMPLFKARKIIKDITVIEPNFLLYKQYSDKFFKIIRKYTNYFEIISLEECYVEITNIWKKYKKVSNLMKCIKNDITSSLNINVSIGASFTKFLAKTATNICKPNGYKVMSRNNFYSQIKNLNIKSIYGVGRSTTFLLKEINIKTVDEYINFKDKKKLHNLLGLKHIYILKCLLGKSSNTINLKQLTFTKSISISHTLRFPIIATNELIYNYRNLCKTLYYRLLYDHKLAKTLTIKIKQDKALNKWRTYQITLDKYTNRYEAIISKIIFLINKSIKKINVIGYGIEFGNLIFEYDVEKNDLIDIEVQKFNDKIFKILQSIYKINKNIYISTLNNISNYE